MPFLAGCGMTWQVDYDRLGLDVDRLAARMKAARRPEADPELDKALAETLDLDTLISAAIDRNPELVEALARVKAGIAEVKRVSSLDDPMLKFEAWGVPLNQPGNWQADQTNIFGLRQDFPFPGNLSLKGEAALRDTESMHEMCRDRRLEIVQRVKKAYFELYALTKEIEIHQEHIKILQEFEKVSEVKYRTGTVSEQDVLKPQVEMVMLHNDVLAIEQRIGSTKATINALLNRPAEAPLGKPREVARSEANFDVQDLTTRALLTRPDIEAAVLKVRSSRAALKLAEREATLPNFSLGVDYWQIPGAASDAYGVMASINLPWLTGKHRAEVRKMEHMLEADEAAVETAQNRASLEVRDAWLRVEAARKSVDLFTGELLPKSKQSVEVSRAGYEKDKASLLDLLDAERSERDVKLKYYQALAQHEQAVADLERAVGGPLWRKP